MVPEEADGVEIGVELTGRYRAGQSCPADRTAYARASREETASTFKELEEAVRPEYTG